MLSIFRRQDDSKKDGLSIKDERRTFPHAHIPFVDELQVQLIMSDADPLDVDLRDMNIQGAGLRMPFHVAPKESDEELVELTVAHPGDNWKVTTLARVRRVEQLDDRNVEVGLQFTNLGDLYAQLDDALGRYFNRRSSGRVKPDLEEDVRVRISYKHHRMRGKAHDISRTGVGVEMPLVQAAVFSTGEGVTVRLEIPGRREPLEAPAIVRHGYRNGENVVLGIEFDLEANSSMKRHKRDLLAYLEKRERAMVAWQQRLLTGQ